jgi:hypothetical protein
MAQAVEVASGYEQAVHLLGSFQTFFFCEPAESRT